MSTITTPTIPEYLEQYGADLERVVAKIRERIDALPDGPQAIADFLEKQNVRGVCSDPQHCAIAEYILPLVPAGWGVEVEGTITVGPVDQNADLLVERVYGEAWDTWDEQGEVDPDTFYEQHHINVMAKIGDFIDAFDANQFPNLEV